MLQSEIQGALRGAIYRLLRPLVRVIVRHGMAYGTFAELARKAFVDETLEQLRRDGQRSSISSVAAITGLTRKEASRLANTDLEDTGESDQRYNRAVRVITAWSIDPNFTDKRGRARLLPLEGDGSFSQLVKEYSGDVTPVAMLNTLEASGTVSATDRGVKLLDRAYLPTQTPAASLDILGTDVAELLTTIDHNLSSHRDSRVFQRKVSNARVDAEALEAFREMSNQKSQELLEDYDAWLSEHEADDGAGSDQSKYVAVGIYYYDKTLDEGADS